MTDIADLAQFRQDKAVPKREAEEAIGPVQPRFPGRILAFDQSLANTGWALIERTGGVSATGNLKTDPTESKGHEDTLQRGSILYGRYRSLIESLGPDLVVHEMPPVGGRMMRPESSLVSANALRNACLGLSVPVEMYGAQKAKKRWTGNGNAKKNEVKEALRRLDPTLASRKPMNEAIFDAIAIGWLACEEQR